MTVADADITVERPVSVQLDSRVVYAVIERAWSSYLVEQRPQFDLVHEHTDGQWVVRDRVTGIFGGGADPLSAVKDFRRAVVEHLDVLERQPALSEPLQEQLQYLRERLTR